MWRIRVGDYRVMYSISDDRQLIIIEQITRRDDQTYERV
jgi:mRNA-degrading endonuclease RelE of RelBE toxin-antitoxin system